VYKIHSLHVIRLILCWSPRQRKCKIKKFGVEGIRREGGGGRRGRLCLGVVFTLVCFNSFRPPTLLFPILVAFCCGSFSVFHLETMDLPFPKYLISDPWQNGHLDILLFTINLHTRWEMCITNYLHSIRFTYYVNHLVAENSSIVLQTIYIVP
jgi:hypothetical protein